MAIVHALRAVFGIPDDLVDKIAQVQNETEPIVRGGTLVFEDHTAICALGALVCILTTDEGKAHGSRVAGRWCGDRSPDPAARPLPIREAVPIDTPRFQTGGEHPAGPVGIS